MPPIRSCRMLRTVPVILTRGRSGRCSVPTGVPMETRYRARVTNVLPRVNSRFGVSRQRVRSAGFGELGAALERVQVDLVGLVAFLALAAGLLGRGRRGPLLLDGLLDL